MLESIVVNEKGSVSSAAYFVISMFAPYSFRHILRLDMTFGQIMSLGYVIRCDVDCFVNLFCVGPDTFFIKKQDKIL